MRITIYSIAALSILSLSTGQACLAAGGIGPGTMNGGAGGMDGRVQKNASHGPADKTIRVPQDNPLVNSPSPPPASASILTKVGWCEVQVFGHTFSDPGLLAASLVAVHMHLPERLDHLNHQIHFEPKKSGANLMDDVDAMVKFIDIHRPQNKPDAPVVQTAAQ